jgi:allophanate hydrolase
MSPNERELSLDLTSLRARYAAKTLTPTALVELLAGTWEASREKRVWIHLESKETLLEAARELERRQRAGAHLPLYGVPFAVKDNIDVAGVPTTAACPGFAHLAERSAGVVEKLLAAGALMVGKTNLDQLATGLVGVRSPYGVAENPFDSERIPRWPPGS